jgi:hypothetical protein
MRLPILCATALCASLASQNYSVSPIHLANTAGNGGNTIPWWSATHRYQQVRGDLRNRVLIMRGVSLRRSFGGTFSSAVARTIDCEMFMGNADFATATGNFTGNYIGTPTNTVVRKMINCPDLTTSVSNPEPWNVLFPHDNLFVYTGANDIAWELKIFSTTNIGTYSIDAHSGQSTGTVTLTGSQIGRGCVASGRSSPMGLTSTFRTISTASGDTHDFAWAAQEMPANAPSVLLIGTTDPALNIPGLCTMLHSSANLTLNGTSTANSTWNVGPLPIPYDPVLVNLAIYSQAASSDAGQPGLPFALSNGDSNRVPPLPSRITRIWVNDVNAATGSRSESYPYGLVTRFTHQ